MGGPDELADVAEAILLFRRNRGRFLPPELFSETAWEFLLELFIADAHGKRLTGHTVAERSGTPDHIISRWLLHLSALGLIVGDGDGDLSDELTLSARALESIEGLLKTARTLGQGLDTARVRRRSEGMQ